jgi:4-hydroxybenzoate polyprenyltransferase
MDWAIKGDLLLLVFFATMLSYCFQRVIRHSSALINSTRHQWIYNNKKYLYSLIIISSGISGCLFFTLFTFYELLYFSPLLAITLFYAVKVFSLSLRDIPFMKIILIALSWAAVTVLIPAYLNEDSSANDTWVLFILNFIYIFALVIPFDIRDLDFDESEKKTIPQLIGMKAAKYTAIILLIICGGLSFVLLKEAIFLVPVYLVSIIVLFQVNDKRKELFYACGIDGLILLFPFSTWIIKSYI